MHSEAKVKGDQLLDFSLNKLILSMSSIKRTKYSDSDS